MFVGLDLSTFIAMLEDTFEVRTDNEWLCPSVAIAMATPSFETIGEPDVPPTTSCSKSAIQNDPH
jgi:hypothetical protein